MNATVRLPIVPRRYWVPAAWLSVLANTAAKGGNLILFASRPTSHWPLLETIEGIAALTMIPLALVLAGLVGQRIAVRRLTWVAIVGMVVLGAVSFVWAAGWLRFGGDPLSMILYGLSWLTILAWLVGVSLAARAASAPRTIPGSALLTILSGTFLYPVWAAAVAVWLTAARLPEPEPQPG